MNVVSNNVKENRAWYVCMTDTGSGISVSLYRSEDDAEAQANVVAMKSVSYGTFVQVDFGSTLEKFDVSLGYHLAISGASGDPSPVIIKTGPFVDLPPVSGEVFVNENLAYLRAQRELDLHTHAVLRSNLRVASAVSSLNPGNLVNLSSSRTFSGKSQVRSITISGDERSLIAELVCEQYRDLVK